MPTTFLNAKMYWARVRPNPVARPRLLEKLERGLRAGHSLTLVSAPPGYGKTTLLIEWLRTKEGRTQLAPPEVREPTLDGPSSVRPASQVAWLTLDEADDDPARFWAYVILALQAVHHELGETALSQLRSAQPPPVQLILPGLLNEINTLHDRAILVLDDYHVVRDPCVHDSIIFFLEHLPGTLHLALSTRTDPPLPLARLRANDLITEVRASDLRFTVGEATTLLNDLNRLDLSAEHIVAITEQTEGWVSGLQLAALSLEGRDPDSRAQLIANFSGRHQFVLDYLTDEVLSRQSESVQAFLLQTSILNRLTGSLCDAVTERSGSQVLLGNLNKANMFLVPLDTEGTWYRYHHLFAELLYARLREYRPGELIGLHTRASAWCEENGLEAEAVRHALAAGDPDRAGRVIKRVARRMFVGSEIKTLLGWLGALPYELVRADLHLSMICAWALLATSRMDAVNPHLEDIERALGVTADRLTEPQALPSSARGALAEVLCIRSNLAFHSRDPLLALRFSEQSIGYLGQDVQQGMFQPRQTMQSILAFNRGIAHELLGDVKAAEAELKDVLAIEPRDWHMVHLAVGHMAQLLIVQGRLGEAAEVCRRALRWASEGPGRPTPYSDLAHAELGTILVEWNQPEEAEAHLRQGLELARPWSNLEALLLAHGGLARLQAAKGDYEGAWRSWEDLREAAHSIIAPWAVALAEAHQASLWARMGRREAARRWTERAAIASHETIPYMQEAEGIVLARVLIELGELERALLLLGGMGQAAEAGGRRGRSIEILVLQALAKRAHGQAAGALSDLRASLALAEPEEYVRVFLDEGESMLDLLQQIASRDRSYAYVGRLLAQSGANQGPLPSGESAKSAASDSPDHLTSRELEVLRLLAEGLSNREIAQILYLSPNTMRVYTYNIYNKLDVHNRMQAVLKGRQMGLLPPSR